MKRLEPGQTIRLTGKFLASTGQTRGGESMAKWTVLACSCGLCAGGRMVCTNEPRELYEDEDPTVLQYRHIARANVEVTHG